MTLAFILLAASITPSANLITSAIEQPSASQNFLDQLPNLLKQEQWRTIVTLGEKALIDSLKKGEMTLQMAIHDQLISTYFRLGEYENALAHSDSLSSLAALSDSAITKINSFYKLSATLRGLANQAQDTLLQQSLFSKARQAIQNSLNFCQSLPPTNKALLARVHFNFGALEMEDPQGDLAMAQSCLKQAATFFSDLENEADYLARTKIRLGKVYLLQDMPQEARRIIEELRQVPLQQRTNMHFLYLEAQLLLQEGDCTLSETKALEAKAAAIALEAKADRQRFEEFLLRIPKHQNKKILRQ